MSGRADSGPMTAQEWRRMFDALPEPDVESPEFKAFVERRRAEMEREMEWFDVKWERD